MNGVYIILTWAHQRGIIVNKLVSLDKLRVIISIFSYCSIIAQYSKIYVTHSKSLYCSAFNDCNLKIKFLSETIRKILLIQQ